MGEAKEGLAASVIVPHYNDRERLSLCLEKLEAQTLDPHTYEIVVCDNATPGGIGALEAAFPDVRFVVEERKGAAHARNAAVAVARGPALAFIDCDCVPERDWLERGLVALAGADLVGGAIRVTYADEERPTPVERFERIFAFDQRGYVERKGFSVTANLFTRAEVFAAVGPFRDGVPEDVDWCHRARARGLSLVYAEEARVSHPARRTWGELRRKWARLVREAFGAERERPLKAPRWAARSLVVLASPAAHVWRVLGSPEAGSWADRLATAGVLVRLRAYRFGAMLSLLLSRDREAAS